MANEQAILEVLDRLRGRFYGKYRGSVTEVEEGGRGRIKAKVPAVLGDTATGWCDPCVPYAGDQVGFAFLPEVGAGVWIEFEGGDVSYPIWTGCYWREGELPSDAAPKKKLIQTKAGHQIVFDDDGESVTIKDSNDNTITLDSSGIVVKRGSGKLEVAESKVTVNDGALEVA
ncbi:MAG TPA: phage baseplate assembly protein V [Kofleriaceae bacterium]|nr:phage baseplate assembly protein V [Kofleriaceae bacterium]